MAKRPGESVPSPKPQPEDLSASGEHPRASTEAVPSVPMSGPTVASWKGEAPPRSVESAIAQDHERGLIMVMIEDAVAQAVDNPKLDPDAKK